jgi:hypothetical protein
MSSQIGIPFIIVLCITSIFFVLFIYKPEPFHDVSAIFNDPIGKLTKQEKVDSLYSPIIIRPREINSQRFNGKCTNELYPQGIRIAFKPKGLNIAKGYMGETNAKIGAQFYAQRPLLNPDQYYNMLQLLLDHINTKSNVPDYIPKELFIHQDQFSQGNTFSNVMKFIMKRINTSKNEVKELKEYASHDTWGGEHFAFTDQKLFSYSRYNTNTEELQENAIQSRKSSEPRKLVVNFNLYNTLRNISTDVIATVYFAHGKYYFDHIEMTTKKETVPWTPVNFGTKSGNINLNNGETQHKPDWIYGNTLENQTFNSKGFHDSDEQNNIFIKGGIPDEYTNFIRQSDVKNSYWTKYYNAQNLKGGPLFPETSTSKLNTKIVPNLKKLNTWTVNV